MALDEIAVWGTLGRVASEELRTALGAFGWTLHHLAAGDRYRDARDAFAVKYLAAIVAFDGSIQDTAVVLAAVQAVLRSSLPSLFVVADDPPDLRALLALAGEPDELLAVIEGIEEGRIHVWRSLDVGELVRNLSPPYAS